MVAGCTDPKPVRRAPLRASHACATVVALAVLAAGEPAHAHLVVRPSLLERGEAVELTVELPRLRAGEPPHRLELEGAGVEVLSARRQEVRRGGETLFAVRVRVDAPPGRLPVVLRAGFPGGETVDVDTAFVVVPAPASGGRPLLTVGVAALLALALAAAALAVARRRAA